MKQTKGKDVSQHLWKLDLPQNSCRNSCDNEEIKIMYINQSYRIITYPNWN